MSSHLQHVKHLGILGFISTAMIFGTSSAQAKVRVYQQGAPASVFVDDLKVPFAPSTHQKASTQAAATLDQDRAITLALAYVAEHREAFELKHVDRKSLAFRTMEQDSQGYSLRFDQKYEGIPVLGAELVALLDRHGKLIMLNSSLVAEPKGHFSATVSRAAALRAASSHVGIQKASEGHGAHDGLYLRGNHLVWQLSLRESSTGGKAAIVQVAASGPQAGQVERVMPGAQTSAVVNVTDWLKGGPASPQTRARFTEAREFYREFFGRLGYDGKDSDVTALVDVPEIASAGAWLGPWKTFAFAEKSGGAGQAPSLEVVGHEYTHAVIDSSSRLMHEGQPGAVSESLADLFGVMIQNYFDRPSDPFRTAKQAAGQASKGKIAPTAAELTDGTTGTLTSMEDLPAKYGPKCVSSIENDACGVHALSAIPSAVSMKVAQALGWERVKQLYYRVMTMRLRSSSDFADFRDQLVGECEATLEPGYCDYIRTKFDEAGI